jgi:type IV secretory pathway TrbL component
MDIIKTLTNPSWQNFLLWIPILAILIPLAAHEKACQMSLRYLGIVFNLLELIIAITIIVGMLLGLAGLGFAYFEMM